MELELDTGAAWGTFCHFRRCRSPLLMLLQVEGRRALLNIYNHLRRIYNNDSKNYRKNALTKDVPKMSLK